MKYIIILSFLLLLPFSSFSSTRSFGHNVAQTDYMLKNKTCSLGLQVLACRVSKVAFAVSPFLLKFYNMNNVFVKYRFHESDKFNHTAQVSYFNTFNKRTNGGYLYDMEAVFGNYIITYKYSPNFTFHLNTILNYYMNDEFPFSIRRPTLKRNKAQLNISALFESRLTKRLYLLGEVGLLHVLDSYPRLHTGASLGYSLDSFYFQFGFNMTSTASGLFVSPGQSQRNDYQQELLRDGAGYSTDMDENLIKEDFAVHPEITVQYSF